MPRIHQPHTRPRSTAYGLDSDHGDDWQDLAACRPGSGVDSELFFPVGTTGPAIEQVEQAKAVCRRCPVVDTCLRHALDTGEQHGVWGGMTEEERREIKLAVAA